MKPKILKLTYMKLTQIFNKHTELLIRIKIKKLKIINKLYFPEHFLPIKYKYQTR